jgi:ATP-dependent DNA helicase RecG
MNLEQINLDLIKQLAESGESQSLEFKKSTADLHGGCESLCGMLNAGEDACLIIGVHGERVVGQEVSDKTQQEIAHVLTDFSPDPGLRWKVLHLRDKLSVVVIQGHCNPEKPPYFFHGKAYLRSGTTTSALSRDRLEHFFWEQHRRVHSYDREEVSDANLDLVDPEWVMLAVRKGMTAQRVPASAGSSSLEEALDKFQLLKDGRLTNAALVLFGKPKVSLSYQTTLMMARFKGTKQGEFSDLKRFDGNALQAVDEGMLFLSRHIPVRARFGLHSLRRTDEPQVPTEVLREALVNVICHRDYESFGTSVHLAVYDDRIEIENRGGLLLGISVDDLKKPHRSVLRNPLVARTLYQSGYIEHWGQGTLKMTKLCIDAGLPEPEFSWDSFWFRTCLRTSMPAAQMTLDKKLARREQILEAIRSRGGLVTIKELETTFPDMSRRTLQRDLQFLEKEKFISESLQGPSTHWVISKK